MTVKRKDETFEEFARRMPPGTIASIDQREQLTKQDVHTMRGGYSAKRIAQMLRGPESDRDLVLESTGLLSDVLGELLVASGVHLVPPQDKLQRRANAARDAGLISPGQHTTISRIGAIRGKFAHDPNLLYFEHDEFVVKWCAELVADSVPRESFVCVATMLQHALNAAVEKKKNPPGA